MNISSILITIVGILIIIALYVVSRIGQINMPNKETSLLPDIKDDNGDVFTSILDDIPASDGSMPAVNKKEPAKDSTTKQQFVLFISAANVSADNNQGLDGDLIKQTLLNNGLTLGDKDIYHYLVKSSRELKDKQSTSLFRVANGVEPWTLTDKDLYKKQLAGLSMVMLLPNTIEDKAALKIFIEMADTIASQTNGILKNQQQETLTAIDRKAIFDV